jgi:hypothetical protein
VLLQILLQRCISHPLALHQLLQTRSPKAATTDWAWVYFLTRWVRTGKLLSVYQSVASTSMSRLLLQMMRLRAMFNSISHLMESDAMLLAISGCLMLKNVMQPLFHLDLGIQMPLSSTLMTMNKASSSEHPFMDAT